MRMGRWVLLFALLAMLMWHVPGAWGAPDVLYMAMGSPFTPMMGMAMLLMRLVGFPLPRPSARMAFAVSESARFPPRMPVAFTAVRIALAFAAAESALFPAPESAACPLGQSASEFIRAFARGPPVIILLPALKIRASPMAGPGIMMRPPERGAPSAVRRPPSDGRASLPAGRMPA